MDVSIHAPAWGATYIIAPSLPIFPRFNPRSRMGSDKDYWVVANEEYVSIHAPAWGATITVQPGPLPFNRFNPRSRMGSDFVVGGQFLEQSVVSIHAPAWGATILIWMYCVSIGSFNPRSRMGSDTASHLSVTRYWRFNPRSRMGSDCFCTSRCCGLPKFQSTLPHGERLVRCNCRCPSPSVSIHAPAWGATCIVGVSVRSPPFQSTLPHGERHPSPAVSPPTT